MNRPMLGDRLAVPAVIGAALLLMSHTSAGQVPSKTYYHVQQVTTGCQNPAAVRLLTNPAETALADARRLRSIRSSGHCVTITPRSQWSFLWRENDMAMMSYAGTVGRPGSYYLRIDDLVDADGRHPDSLETDPDPIAGEPGGANDSAGLSQMAGPPAQTSGIPTIIPPTTPPKVAAANPPAKSLDDLIPKSGNTRSAFPQEAGGSESEAASPSQPWVPAISLALFAGALAGFAVLRRRQGKSAQYDPALQIAVGEIQAQSFALREAKAESTRPDRYGTVHPDGWQREKASFVSSRISPRLRAAGYENLLPSLLSAIDSEIERHANSLVDPIPTDTGRIPGDEENGKGAVDAELLNYASHCTALLQNAGWTIDPKPIAYGKAVDILAERDGRKLLLQCKGDSAPVGVEAVQQVHTLKERRQVDIVAIVTHAPFTRAAQQMASANGVHALRDEDLIQLIR